MVKNSDKNSVRFLVFTFLFAFAGFALAMYLFFLHNRNFSGQDYNFLIDSPGRIYLTPETKAMVMAKQAESLSQNFRPFQAAPSLIIWMLIQIIGLAFAGGMAYESWLIYKKMRRVFSEQLHGIFVFIFSIVLLSVFLPGLLSHNYRHQLFPPISDFDLKLNLITAVHAIAAGLAIVCLVLTGNLAFRLRKRTPETNAISHYATLHQLQLRLLLMLGFQLTVGIIATAFMREVQIELYGEKQNFIEKEGVAYYGIFYTFLIAVFFIPARRELIQFGHRIVDRECGKRPVEGKSWKDWMEEREVLVKLFKLEMSFKELIEWAIPVLAPLIASILPEFLRSN